MAPHPTAPRRTPLGSIELLVAIDTHGSISAAARALDIAQPSVSAGLRRLERGTGLGLVVRSTGGTVLTDLGRRVVVRARDVLAASDAFEAEVAALSAELDGRLTIAASMTIAEYLVPHWLAARPARAAVVDLDVANSRAVMEAVLHGRADLGFIEGPDLAEGLRARSIGHDELLIVAAPGHPWADLRRAVGAAELATAPLVLREAGSGTRATLERALEAAGHPLASAPAQLGSTAAVKSVVQGGRAVAVLSALTVQGELALGTLRSVRVEGVDLRRDLRMVWARGRQPAPAARELAALVVTLTSGGQPAGSGQRKPLASAQATA